MKASVFVEAVSWLLGLLDLLCLLLRFDPNKFLSRGWGDLTCPASLHEEMTRSVQQPGTSNAKSAQHAVVDKPEIEWADDDEALGSDGVVTVRKGKFPSPAAKALPEESKYCEFSLVNPSQQDNTGSVYIIMFPATGEVGKSERLKIATQLAEQYGWSSVIVTAPFYANRKPNSQTSWQLDTVSDVIVQSQAIVQEGTALMHHFLQQSSNTRVVLTGFSWGGAISSCVAALALLVGLDGSRVACVPYVGVPSPASLADGLLENAVDWSGLGDVSKRKTYQQLRQELISELLGYHLGGYTELLPGRQKKPDDRLCRRLGVVHVTVAKHDRIILKKYVTAFLHHLEDLRAQIHTVEHLPGGHVSASFQRSNYHTRAIVVATEKLVTRI